MLERKRMTEKMRGRGERRLIMKQWKTFCVLWFLMIKLCLLLKKTLCSPKCHFPIKMYPVPKLWSLGGFWGQVYPLYEKLLKSTWVMSFSLTRWPPSKKSGVGVLEDRYRSWDVQDNLLNIFKAAFTCWLLEVLLYDSKYNAIIMLLYNANTML